jgi:hypothetical protein
VQRSKYLVYYKSIYKRTYLNNLDWRCNTHNVYFNLDFICHSINDLEIDAKSLFQNGDKIEILNSSFKGITAIFAAQDGLERSMLLLKVLNQENKISFNNKDIKKLED